MYISLCLHSCHKKTKNNLLKGQQINYIEMDSNNMGKLLSITIHIPLLILNFGELTS